MKNSQQIQTDLQAMLQRARSGHTYKLERAKLEITEGIVALMEAKGVSKSELAERIDVSPAYITKILRGSTNFTLDTMVKIATALDAEFCCHLKPAGHRTQWFDVIDGCAQPPAFDLSEFKPVPRVTQRIIDEAINQ